MLNFGRVWPAPDFIRTAQTQPKQIMLTRDEQQYVQTVLQDVLRQSYLRTRCVHSSVGRLRNLNVLQNFGF